MKRLLLGLAALAMASASAAAPVPGFLGTRGTQIVDGDGKPVILRGMGLGGWMLQEGYMLKLGELGQQHVIHRRLAELVGQDAVDEFQRAWLDHHMTKADMDALGRWGFNSVRLPMHYALFLDPSAPAGTDRWNEDGFRRVDRLLDWAAANRMWVILDLHAAPGGQGSDLAISDRDPTQPSLWDSAENQRRTVALWREIARRYAGNPWVGGYDILNEPNWDFDGPGGGHGCDDKNNRPIAALYKRITAAIREHDRNHLIVIEGNCWGNNYAGITPDWDDKLVLSFHKYWNRNDAASIAGIVKLRDDDGTADLARRKRREFERLVPRRDPAGRDNDIGWSWWPLKKIGFNNPLEVVPNPGWQRIVDWLTGKGPRPGAAEARAAMLQLATHDVDFANNVVHPDVVDAMMRQPHSDRALPFREHRLGRGRAGDRRGRLRSRPAGHRLCRPRRCRLSHRHRRRADRVERRPHLSQRRRRHRPRARRDPLRDGVRTRRVDAIYARRRRGRSARGDVDDRRRSAGDAVLIASTTGRRSTLAVPAGGGWQTVPVPALSMLQGTNRLKAGGDLRNRQAEGDPLSLS